MTFFKCDFNGFKFESNRGTESSFTSSNNRSADFLKPVVAGSSLADIRKVAEVSHRQKEVQLCSSSIIS